MISSQAISDERALTQHVCRPCSTEEVSNTSSAAMQYICTFQFGGGLSISCNCYLDDFEQDFGLSCLARRHRNCRRGAMHDTSNTGRFYGRRRNIVEGRCSLEKHCIDQSRHLRRYNKDSAAMLAIVQCNRVRTCVPSGSSIFNHFSRRYTSRLGVMPATKPSRTRQSYEHRWPSSHSEEFLPSAGND